MAKETKEICEGLNITDVNTTYLTKNEYKLLVDGAIKRKNEEWLRKEAEGKRKCEKIMRETFGKKDYITKNKVGEVRNIFKARVGMSEFAEVAGKLPGSCRIGKCCNSKFSRTAVRWYTNICDSKHSICKSDDSKHKCYGIYGSSRKNHDILARRT